MAKKHNLTKGVELAVKAAGSKYALAAKLKTSRQNIGKWRQVPADRVLQIESLLGVSRHDMRPDVFGVTP